MASHAITHLVKVFSAIGCQLPAMSAALAEDDQPQPGQEQEAGQADPAEEREQYPGTSAHRR